MRNARRALAESALGGVFANSAEVLIADIGAALALPAATTAMRTEVIETVGLTRGLAATSAPILSRESAPRRSAARRGWARRSR